MEEKLKEFEDYRTSVCKKANRMLWIGILMLIVGFLLIMYTGLPIFVLLIVVGFVFIGINVSMKSKLSTKFKNEFIVKLVKEVYPESIYYPNSGIDLEEMLRAGFFKRPDMYNVEDYLSASYDGVPFEMCDFDFKEEHVTRDSKGNTRVTYVTYAKGRYMIFDFKRDFQQVVKVVENTYLGLNRKGLENVETESLEFNKKFKVFTSDGITAFYVLTPQIQLKILELESKFKGSLFLAYMQGKLFVAITDGVSILDVNASKKVTADTLKMLESQLMLPASVINELGLSSTKFTIGDAI